MAAAIPADTLQFFGIALRLSQELAYLFDYKDIWEEEIGLEQEKSELILFLGVKVTKDTFAKGVSKTIPVLGGVLSGGITYLTMKKMGNRLRKSLYESVNYSIHDLEKDFNEIKKEMSDVIDVEFSEVEEAIFRNDYNEKEDY